MSASRILLLAAALFLVTYGGIFIWAVDKSPDAIQEACRLGLCDVDTVQKAAHLLTVSGEEHNRAVGDYKLLLRQDPGSPYNWTRLAFALADSGDRATAARCIDQAVRLAPGSAPLLMEVLNYHMTVGDYAAVLPTGRKLLALVKDYDPFVFHYYEQAAFAPAIVLASGIPPNAVRGSDYLRYLVAVGDQASAEAAWQWLRDHQRSDRATLNAFTGFLGARKAYSKAWAAWRNFYGNEGAGNLLFNGGFEQPLAEGPFDWELNKDSDATIAIDPGARVGGNPSLRIEFSGNSNIAFQHVSHLIFSHGGPLRLSGWVKCSGLTTNEGVLLRISDRDTHGLFTFESEPVRDQCDWKEFHYSLTVPGPDRLLRLEIVRRPSAKFDNKIAGVVWFGNVRLSVD